MKAMPPAPGELDRRSIDLVRRGWVDPPGEEEWEALALDLFAHQFERVLPYRRLCLARGRTPETVREWREIPLVPTECFKDEVLSTVGAQRAGKVFETSGTTRGRPGRHYLEDARLYREALAPTFRHFVLPDRERIRMAVLAPAGRDAPRSSLSFMLDALIEDFAMGETPYLVSEGGLDHAGLARALHAARAEGEPILLAGTSFAFVHAVDELDRRGERFRLPPGSRIVDTGGSKGRSRDVARPELLASYERAFGVGPELVVGEYGMTELASQFYERHLARGEPPEPAGRVLAGPPWARARILSPETLADVRPGERGLVAVHDLLNRSSISAVLTADEGILREGGFELLGRAAGAEPRGCGMAMDARLGGA